MSRHPGGKAASGGFALAALAAYGAVGAALFTQYQWNMQPCPWCVLQRLIFLVIGTLAALAALLPARGLRTLLTVLISLLSAGGVSAALWQHFVAAKSASCNLTLADRIVGFFHLDTLLPAVFEVRANCADAAVDLLGVPYDVWSLLLFVVLAALAWTARSQAAPAERRLMR